MANNSYNSVLSAVLDFCCKDKKPTPENLVWGYAKLLLMDEASVRYMLADDGDFADLEQAHAYFSEHKLDLDLIKTGIPLLAPFLPKGEARQEEYTDYYEFLEKDAEESNSRTVLEVAVKNCIPDIVKEFAEGRTMEDIFSCRDELKKTWEEQNKDEEKEKEEEGDSSEEEKKQDASGEEEDKDDAEVEEMLQGTGRTPAKKGSAEGGKSPARKGSDSGKSKAKEEEKPLTLAELSEKYRRLTGALPEVVKGQDYAVLKFVQGYNQGELLRATEKSKKPRSYFFFFGPPGVGKTLLAETAAEALDIPHKTFNMSEYSAHQAHEDLIGISKIYSSAKEGTLVKFVRENPRCLLIFDEIEKAHINVIRLFLQILGSGNLNNVYRDEEVSFRDTTIIFTSNVAKALYSDRSVDLTSLPEKVLIDAIEREKNSNGDPVLPLEMCSRIASGNIVMFNHLSTRHLAGMVSHYFEQIVEGMSEAYHVSVTCSKYLPLLFLYNRGGEIDARIASGQSGKFLKDEIFELLRQLENNHRSGEVSSIDIDIEWEGMDPDLRRLFINEEKEEVLFFTDRIGAWPESASSDKYVILRANTFEEAKEYLSRDLAAVFIDPFFGESGAHETVLSIADYNTGGVRLFRDLTEQTTDLPIYMIERDPGFSEVDRRTFLQEGASGILTFKPEQEGSFKRQFEQVMDELYMERESQIFSQRGWVIDYKTKQDTSAGEGMFKIRYYDLKKKKAVDLESRGSILSDAERPNVHFDDVIGAENAKEDLRYYVKYLQNPKQFLMNGGKAPRGVLLYGPPGTGKTMLARAMAGESEVSFFQTSASEFMNMYVGESEANIRRIFAKAKKYAPSIIFIDEIDAIGKKRVGGINAGTTESMLNALLTEMEGFSSSDNTSKPVFVLAATNYGVGEESDGIAALDEALVRRFDNKIYVDLPKEEERKIFILRTLEHKKVTTVSEQTAQSIAERTTGQSLAILQNVIDLAFRLAMKEGRQMEDKDLLTALEEYNYGEKKEHTPEYYRSVAIHETGHAYLSYISGDKPSYITIESRGNFGGYMQHSNQEEVPNYTKEELLARIRSALAGRAAEIVFFGEKEALNTGASSDLEHATNLAFRILCSYGMEDQQLVVLSREEVLKSELASEYVKQVNEILSREMKNTIEIITEAKEKIRSIADVLVKENRLTGKQFEALMEGNDYRDVAEKEESTT
jgi:ATP-dependent metalloprotease FtsH